MLDRILAMEATAAETLAALAHRFAPGAQLPHAREITMPGYTRIGSVAVVEISGVLSKHPSWLSWIMGGTSMRAAGEAIGLALRDNAVSAIVLRIDSPGGTVAGAHDLARVVWEAKQQKPVVSFVEDLAASAAYLIGSQAMHLTANENGLVGGIGTFLAITDWSEFFERSGLRQVIVKFGRWKGAAVPGTRISDEMVSEVFQPIVDSLGALFVRDVARGRKLTVNAVKGWADGLVHVAARAKDLGMIDRVGTLNSEIELLQRDDPGNLRPVMVAGVEGVTAASVRPAKVTDGSVTTAGSDNPTHRRGGKYSTKGRSYVGCYGS